ncbi:MAG: T9SS type A sorting domain-containing protein [Bacteroidetes bacterium]|nr:T9SS type A sorting domain-containing protein [Bacteroidota bacterium]
MKIKIFIHLVSFFCSLLFVQSAIFSQSVWTTQYLNNVGGNQLRRVQFVNQNIGWACGGNGTLIKTTNGGDTWTPMSTGSTSYLTCIYFIDENTGWIGSQQAVIKKTTNGGISWYSAPIQTSDFSSDFFFLNGLTGFVTSHDSKIHKTTDGGQTWNLLIASSNAYGQIQFFDANTGVVVAPSYFGKSVNGGATWTRVLYDGVNQAMTFINPLTGWITGTGGIRKTTDGGDTWSSYALPIQTPYALKFFNANVGWCAGSNGANGIIARTLNGGVNWTVQSTEASNVFWEMSFANQNLGWASGNAIISSTQNGGLVSVSQISTTVPNKFSLNQNYPNPFNPSTKISFDIKNSTFASLKIFDVTGKEVKTLVNENISAGRYEINFNAYELNSGVYLYTLTTSEFTETKKMMLVK